MMNGWPLAEVLKILATVYFGTIAFVLVLAAVLATLWGMVLGGIWLWRVLGTP